MQLIKVTISAAIVLAVCFLITSQCSPSALGLQINKGFTYHKYRSECLTKIIDRLKEDRPALQAEICKDLNLGKNCKPTSEKIKGWVSQDAERCVNAHRT